MESNSQLVSAIQVQGKIRSKCGWTSSSEWTKAEVRDGKEAEEKNNLSPPKMTFKVIPGIKRPWIDEATAY